MPGEKSRARPRALRCLHKIKLRNVAAQAGVAQLIEKDALRGFHLFGCCAVT
jgi:hypothetical protein